MILNELFNSDLSAWQEALAAAVSLSDRPVELSLLREEDGRRVKGVVSALEKLPAEISRELAIGVLCESLVK